MEVKVCIRCHQAKPQEAFHRMNRLSGKHHPYCKECKRQYNRRHYLDHKARYLELIRAKKRERLPENRRRLQAYLLLHPCVDCGETDPIVLEFDHLDPEIKTVEVAQMLADYRWERIEKEIAKCAVRCANCHRRRTAHQFGWYTTRPPSSW
jgi:hypothetical protein